jgi:ketosteroid isomerase-like protein
MSDTTTQAETDHVAALQREWIFAWDKAEGPDLREFRAVFDRFYDFDADVILFDEADPQRRTFRTVHEYGEAFWPTFTAMRSATHAIAEGPDVLVLGDLASGWMTFIAILTAADGKTTSLLCRNSLVWRRTEDRDWHIVRDQTVVEPLPHEEAVRYFD